MDVQRQEKSKRRRFGKFRTDRLNNRSLLRLNWEHMEPQGGLDVVKGVSHRVIVVKSPDKYFEEAIFVIREDVLKTKGASSEAVMREARRAANSYVSGRNRPVNGPLKNFFTKLPAPFFVAAGAVAAGITWLALHLCGV